ncbi:DUF4833 domain-containing protein [Stappia sp.]|uniref:DUF4833 domain-containing protein n=1 Tax=Stappia sp. TaxID=1870903 RepID=UPI0032D9140B
MRRKHALRRAGRGGARRAAGLTAGVAALAGLLWTAPAVAQEGTEIRHAPQQKAVGSQVEIVDELPVIRPEFPVPDEPNMLFYLQRSTNPNTIVYAAQFREDGRLDPREPVVAYWRRFNTTGERKPLKMMEDAFAFGVRAQATGDPDVFDLYVVSYPERKATVRLVEPGRAELVLQSGRHAMRPLYAYVDVDESGLVPSVRKVVVLGRDAETGKALVERIQIE